MSEETCQGEGNGKTELSNLIRVDKVSTGSSATRGALSLFSEDLQPNNKINAKDMVAIFISLYASILQYLKSLVQVIKNK